MTIRHDAKSGGGGAPATGGVKKVGGAAPAAGAEKEGKVKKEKVKKVAFEIKDAKMADAKDATKIVSALNEDNELITGVPIGFDFTKNKPLKKTVFALSGYYMIFRAEMLSFKANKLAETAKAMKEAGERSVKLGDDKTAKKVKKAERTAKELVALRAELEAAGVDIAALLGKAETDAKKEIADAAAAAKK